MSLDKQFINKKYLVGSAGNGIGRAVAVRLYQYGATVYAVANSEEPLTSLRKECPNIQTLCVDLANWEATLEALNDIEVLDGVINNSTLNKLINNTGVDGLQPVLGITVDKFEEIINQTLKSTLNVSQITATKMIEAQKAGSIVNVSTLANRATIPNAASYRASKAALDELTKSLAYELGRNNIRVNAVSLGCVWTPAFQRIMEMSTGNSNPGFVIEAIKASTSVGGDPLVPMEDVINTILFVLSDLPSKMSGGNVILDAGLSAT